MTAPASVVRLDLGASRSAAHMGAQMSSYAGGLQTMREAWGGFVRCVLGGGTWYFLRWLGRSVQVILKNRFRCCLSHHGVIDRREQILEVETMERRMKRREQWTYRCTTFLGAKKVQGVSGVHGDRHCQRWKNAQSERKAECCKIWVSKNNRQVPLPVIKCLARRGQDVPLTCIVVVRDGFEK